MGIQSIQVTPTLGPKVCNYYLHWAIGIPRVNFSETSGGDFLQGFRAQIPLYYYSIRALKTYVFGPWTLRALKPQIKFATIRGGLLGL